MMKRNWIKTNALFITDLQELGIPSDDEVKPFRFDLNEVVAYNEAPEKGTTTIWLMDSTVIVEMPIERFDELFDLR